MRSLQTANVDLKEWTMRGGVKTEAGKNRLVPVHSKFKVLFKSGLNSQKPGISLSMKERRSVKASTVKFGLISW